MKKEQGLLHNQNSCYYGAVMRRIMVSTLSYPMFGYRLSRPTSGQAGSRQCWPMVFFHFQEEASSQARDSASLPLSEKLFLSRLRRGIMRLEFSFSGGCKGPNYFILFSFMARLDI
jgi:hypothetical protein